jgi:hypothetical protein
MYWLPTQRLHLAPYTLKMDATRSTITTPIFTCARASNRIQEYSEVDASRAVAYCKVVSQHVPGGTEENYEICQSRWSVSGTRASGTRYG